MIVNEHVSLGPLVVSPTSLSSSRPRGDDSPMVYREGARETATHRSITHSLMDACSTQSTLVMSTALMLI